MYRIAGEENAILVRAVVCNSLSDFVDSPPIAVLVVHGVRGKACASSFQDLGANGLRVSIPGVLGVVIWKLDVEPNEAMFARDEEYVAFGG